MSFPFSKECMLVIIPIQLIVRLDLEVNELHDIFSCEGLRHESHDVLYWGLPLLVLIGQFGDETRSYSYRVEVRGSASSCGESFVEEFLWKGSAHRPKASFDVG